VSAVRAVRGSSWLSARLTVTAQQAPGWRR
jgi:hypothetical protein